MKVLKYIAVLAATLLACSTYAAGEAAPVNVVVNNDNGVLHVSVALNVTNPTETSEEAVKAALKAALNSVGADTLNGRAISAAMIAIKSALADPNASALGSVSVSFAISNKVDGADNVANVKTIATIAGDAYEANTETRFNPETQVASTQGNVSSKASAAAKPVIMTVDANGKVTGSVGNATVADTTVDTAAKEALLTPTSVQEAETSTTVVPDNTIVASGTN